MFACGHVAWRLAQCLMEFILPIALLCLMELLLACCSGLSNAWEGLDFAFLPPSNKGVVVLPASTIATTAGVLALAFSTPRHTKVRFTLSVVAWCAAKLRLVHRHFCVSTSMAISLCVSFHLTLFGAGPLGGGLQVVDVFPDVLIPCVVLFCIGGIGELLSGVSIRLPPA